MIRLNNLPDNLLKSTITDSALSLTCLIHEALRREMRVEISVNVNRNFEGVMAEWEGLKVTIKDKEVYRG